MKLDLKFLIVDEYQLQQKINMSLGRI